MNATNTATKNAMSNSEIPNAASSCGMFFTVMTHLLTALLKR